MLTLPSQVAERKYLRMPQVAKVVDSDEEWSKCGEWILHNLTGDGSWTDKAWVSLQVLLEKGSLLMIKATSAGYNAREKMVLCYTKPGKEAIRRAAEAIRKVVHYEGMMFYKTNWLREAKIDRRYGHKDVAVYMHSYLGRFYRRDFASLWRLDEDTENDAAVGVPFGLNYKDSEILADELPSKSSNLELIAGTKSFRPGIKGELYITTICSIQQDNPGRLTDADRLWMAGLRLLEKGELEGMFCTKSPETAELKVYVNRSLSECSLTRICDTMFKISHVKGFMYFQILEEKMIDNDIVEISTVKCKLSSEGELYRNDKFVELNNVLSAQC